MPRVNRVTACCLAGLVLVTGQSSANPLRDLVGLSGDSGKLAKFEFRLRDSIPVTAVAWSPNGRYIATASTESNLVHIWDVEQRSVIKELKLESAGMQFHNLAWSPDGRYLAACGNVVLHVYATDSWMDAGSFTKEQTAACIRPAFSSDGQQMALLTWPRYARVFSVPSWQVLKTLDLHGDWVAKGSQFAAIAYLPSTSTVVLAGSDYRGPRSVGAVWLWRGDKAVPDFEFQAYGPVGDGHGGSGGAISLTVSPSGKQVATGTHTGSGSGEIRTTVSVHVFDTSTGKLLAAPLDGAEPFGAQTGLAYTPDGRFLIVGHEESVTKAVHLIDARSLQVVDVVHAGGTVYDIAVHPQSTRFAAGAGGQVLVWALPK